MSSSNNHSEPDNSLTPRVAINITKSAKKQQPAPKPTSERMTESVNLVKQLADVGIGKTHPHMIALRDILNKWIRDPEFSYNGRVDFDAYGRRGDLILPRVTGHVASIRLRAL